MSANKVTGTFTATGNSSPLALRGGVNFQLWGTFSAVVQPQVSTDGGTTWTPMSADGFSTPMALTQPTMLTLFQPETDFLYRLSCTFTSGTVSYRISGNGS